MFFKIFLNLEAAPGFEPGITVLQTIALPLGYAAQKKFYIKDPTKLTAPALSMFNKTN